MTTVCGVGGWVGPLPGDPDNNVFLTATPAFGGIDISWTYPLNNSHAVAHVLLYRGINAIYENAMQLAVVAGNFFYDKLATGTEYFYWIHIVSVNGTVGTAIGPASAMARPLIGDLITELTGKIDAGVLAQALKTDIDQIKLIDRDVKQEILNRIAESEAISIFLARVQAEADTVSTLVQNEITRSIANGVAIVNTIDAVGVTANNNTAAIANERVVRADADSALISDVTVLKADTLNNSAAIVNEQSLRSNADLVIAKQINGLTVNDTELVASILEEKNTRISDGEAISTLIVSLQSTVTANAAAAVAANLRAMSAAEAAQATADGTIRTYYQNEAPTGLNNTSHLGDLWYDTNDNLAYRWNGLVWNLISDAATALALAAAQNAQATADGKIDAYYQKTAPVSGMTTGDLWYDTDDGNKPYYYTGSSWLLIQDTAITTAQDTANKAAADIVIEAETRVTRDTAITKSVTDLQSLLEKADTVLFAAIKKESETRVDNEILVAKDTATAQVKLGESIASVRTDMTSSITLVDNKAVAIGALYTAKVSVNGLVGGFGVHNDGMVGGVSAHFDVDTFSIGRSAAIGGDESVKRKPFIVSEGEVFINEAVINKLTFANIRNELGSIIGDATGKLKASHINTRGLKVTSDSGVVGLEVDAAGNTTFGGDLTGASGTFSGSLDVKSALNGARMEIRKDVILVFDGISAFPRIKIGNLSA